MERLLHSSPLRILLPAAPLQQQLLLLFVMAFVPQAPVHTHVSTATTAIHLALATQIVFVAAEVHQLQHLQARLHLQDHQYVQD
jgi:hypothetical protein